METGMRFFNYQLQEIVFDETKGYPFRDWFTDNVQFIYIIHPDKAISLLDDEGLDEFANDVRYYYERKDPLFYYDFSENTFKLFQDDINWYSILANDLRQKQKVLLTLINQGSNKE